MPDLTTQQQELLNAEICVNGVPWYTYQQLALISGASHQTVFNWAKSGRVEKKHLGGITLYRPKEVMDEDRR